MSSDAGQEYATNDETSKVTIKKKIKPVKQKLLVIYQSLFLLKV
jgi:hypothetical protein